MSKRPYANIATAAAVAAVAGVVAIGTPAQADASSDVTTVLADVSRVSLTDLRSLHDSVLFSSIQRIKTEADSPTIVTAAFQSKMMD